MPVRRSRVTSWPLAAALAVALTAALLTIAPLLARAHSTQTEPLRIAAASDLQAVLPELLRQFEADTGTKAVASFGASGSFFAQIRNGAPFDVFFSADIDYPQQLIAAGSADADTLYRYATGRLVVWTRKDTAFPITRGLAALTDPRVRRIAIANPAHAPYGRAAVAALRHAGLYDTLQPRLVLGENISQTAQLVDSGNADAGILALSLAAGPALTARGTYVEIPADAHPPIEQALVIISASRQKDAARRLTAYVRRPEVRDLLRHFGFGAGQ